MANKSGLADACIRVCRVAYFAFSINSVHDNLRSCRLVLRKHFSKVCQEIVSYTLTNKVAEQHPRSRCSSENGTISFVVTKTSSEMIQAIGTVASRLRTAHLHDHQDVNKIKSLVISIRHLLITPTQRLAPDAKLIVQSIISVSFTCMIVFSNRLREMACKLHFNPGRLIDIAACVQIMCVCCRRNC